MIFPGRCATSLNVYIYYPATELMGKKRVTYLNSAKATLLSEPNFSAWKIVFQEVPNFPSHFFPRWKWYFCLNHDWKSSFPNPDWICGEKSVISSTLGEYSQILQLVPRILKCTLGNIKYLFMYIYLQSYMPINISLYLNKHPYLKLVRIKT